MDLFRLGYSRFARYDRRDVQDDRRYTRFARYDRRGARYDDGVVVAALERPKYKTKAYILSQEL